MGVGGIIYYTILYPTPIPQVTRMFDVYLKIYSGKEREKMEKRVRVSTYYVCLIIFAFFFFFFFYMSFTTKI